jgi:hypothetical protein
MVVDQSGQAIRYHDGHWDRPVRIEAAADVNGLQSVSCGSARLCMALDRQGRVSHFDGTTWSRPTPIAPNVALDSVSCPTATFCLALGNRVARWTGSRWRTTPSPLPRNRSTTALSCSSAAFCMVVYRRADGGNAAWTYQQRTWARVGGLAQSYSEFNLSCTSRRFCMATVGDSFTYIRWDGTRWHRGRIDVPMIADPQSVSCTSWQHCVMAGTFLHPESAEWNGHEWTRLREFDTSPRQRLAALSCSGIGTRCLAVDIMGGAFRYRRHSWHRAGRHDPGWGITVAVSCGATMCLAADEAGGYVRTRGHGWSRPLRAWRNGAFGGRGFASLSCASDTFCLALEGNGIARRYDGRRWHYAGRSPVGPGALSCVSARWCAAMDPYVGRISVYRGGRWHEPVGRFPDVGEPWDVSCGSRTLCIATTGFGLARVFDGTRWGRPKTVSPKYASAGGVSCVSGTFCMVIASYGHSWQYDGTRWHRVPLAANPIAIACTGARFCAEVDTEGVRLFDGTTWRLSTTLQQPDGTSYDDIDCASRALCVVGSSANRVVVGTSG